MYHQQTVKRTVTLLTSSDLRYLTVSATYYPGLFVPLGLYLESFRESAPLCSVNVINQVLYMTINFWSMQILPVFHEKWLVSFCTSLVSIP